MIPYNHHDIEKKWQDEWERTKVGTINHTSTKPTFYGLIEFPYPSGDGLHVGHIRSNTAMDIIARKRRAEGFEVLYPIGYDAFGLPTENYAIKKGIHPSIVTKNNTDTFRRQLKSLGFSFDWSSEINTTDPAYYKWTQWIFLQLYKKGLAYKKKMPINWCPSCKIGLANEEVVDGACERCGAKTEQKDKEQWMLAITKYADRLDSDLDTVDFLEKIKIQQRNWIGKSEGALLSFALKGQGVPEDSKIQVFTTRADTFFGVTYVVIAPEHELVSTLAPALKNAKEVAAYQQQGKKKDRIERTAADKEKTGVMLDGVVALHPATGESVPVFVADYVLADYGTGAVMAVPAHDDRDFAFAKKYSLPIRAVIMPASQTFVDAKGQEMRIPKKGSLHYDASIQNISQNLSLSATTDLGVLINSGEFDGMTSEVAISAIAKKFGEIKTTYKLRDWVFSRQHYWGEPIPLVYCAACEKKTGEGFVMVPEKDLPVTLPDVEKYEPTETGESPLAAITSWVETSCPTCGSPARRETDTMPNWAGSSWYYLRYVDAHNTTAFADFTKMKRWLPVDWYNGGMEHTTLHLLYSRFWHKVLFDLNLVPTSEPYQKRTSHGLVLAEGGVKMSKSKGNVVNPDSIVGTVGADALRLYEMFMGPFDQPIAWSNDGVVGTRRFIERVWNLSQKCASESSTVAISQLHQTIKKVSADIEAMKFNTAVSALMVLANTFEKEAFDTTAYGTFLKLLSPFVPHVTEELWQMLGQKESIHVAVWPQYDETLIETSAATYAVQVNGKVRAEFVPTNQDEDNLISKEAQSLPAVAKWIEGKVVKKVIVVKGKLVSIVVA